MSADLMHANHHQCTDMFYSMNSDCLAQTRTDIGANKLLVKDADQNVTTN